MVRGEYDLKKCIEVCYHSTVHRAPSHSSINITKMRSGIWSWPLCLTRQRIRGKLDFMFHPESIEKTYHNRPLCPFPCQGTILYCHSYLGLGDGFFRRHFWPAERVAFWFNKLQLCRRKPTIGWVKETLKTWRSWSIRNMSLMEELSRLVPQEPQQIHLFRSTLANASCYSYGDVLGQVQNICSTSMRQCSSCFRLTLRSMTLLVGWLVGQVSKQVGCLKDPRSDSQPRRM